MNRKVFRDERSREEVLLCILICKANFQKGYVSPRNNTNGRCRDGGNDAHSPALFVVGREGYESRVMRGGGWKSLGSSELLQVNCAFRGKECWGLFLSGNLRPGWGSCHSASTNV